MENYEKASITLINTQLKNMSAAKNMSGTTLRKTKKNFESEELFLATRQKKKKMKCFH